MAPVELPPLLQALLDDPVAVVGSLKDVLPRNVLRGLASSYPDARVRRMLWQHTQVELGEDTYPNMGMIVVDEYSATGAGLLRIGSRVAIAPRVTFVCDSGPNASRLAEDAYVQERLIRTAPIVVEDDVWIGAGVTVLPGVTIGAASVVGAHSLVTGDVAPRSVVAGSPARLLRSLPG